MAYKNTLKGFLKFEESNEEQTFFYKTFDIQGRYYHLSHSLNNKNDPQEMGIKEIKRYIEKNYVNADDINKYELINDLNIFKTLREEYKIKNEVNTIYNEVLSLIITIVTISLTIAIGFLALDKQVVKSFSSNPDNFYRINFNFILKMMKFFVQIIIISMILLYLRKNKGSVYNKLKTINHVIFTLEFIEENLVEIPDSKVFELELKSNINQKSDECIDSKKYILKYAESLEDKS